MSLSSQARAAVYLGSLCSVSYFAVYIARNLLGAVTPLMLEGGATLDFIGRITALYLLAYASGQLINGFIGDRVKAKYMISLGLLSAGVSNFVFVEVFPTAPATVVYALTGFSLSMIYGPMTRVVAESTTLVYATRCSLGYTVASFLGSPMAGVLAVFLSWQATFRVSSGVLVSMAAVCFIFFTLFERRGIVVYGTPSGTEQRPKKDYRVLLRRHFVKFCGISALTGVIRTSLIGYLSTYFCEYLGYSEESAASIFSVTTFIVCFTSFIAVFLYERLGRDLQLSTLIFFAAAALLFAVLYFVKAPVPNIVLMTMAIMASGAAATMLWSVYCPSMRDTGLVSGATGFLDFVSYASAALGSLLIPILVRAIGWSGMILVLFALMALGTGICIPYLFQRRK